MSNRKEIVDALSAALWAVHSVTIEDAKNFTETILDVLGDEDYAIVPREPNHDMKIDGGVALLSEVSSVITSDSIADSAPDAADAIYRAMIKAAESE